MGEFDRFRAPITEAEIERRNPDQLSPAQFRYLCQWGYPYVFEAFRFHMTLTGRVGREDSPRVRAALEELFAGIIGRPLGVSDENATRSRPGGTRSSARYDFHRGGAANGIAASG